MNRPPPRPDGMMFAFINSVDPRGLNISMLAGARVEEKTRVCFIRPPPRIVRRPTSVNQCPPYGALLKRVRLMCLNSLTPRSCDNGFSFRVRNKIFNIRRFYQCRLFPSVLLRMFSTLRNTCRLRILSSRWLSNVSLITNLICCSIRPLFYLHCSSASLVGSVIDDNTVFKYEYCNFSLN